MLQHLVPRLRRRLAPGPCGRRAAGCRCSAAPRTCGPGSDRSSAPQGSRPRDLARASAFGHGMIQPASANSAVQMTSIEMRSMSLSSAARRRTSCSRCWVASAGSGSTTSRYSPFAASVHCFAAAARTSRRSAVRCTSATSLDRWRLHSSLPVPELRASRQSRSLPLLGHGACTTVTPSRTRQNHLPAVTPAPWTRAQTRQPSRDRRPVDRRACGCSPSRRRHGLLRPPTARPRCVRSVFKLGHDVNVHPCRTPASIRIHGPWQITATGLPASTSSRTRWTAAWSVRISVRIRDAARQEQPRRSRPATLRLSCGRPPPSTTGRDDGTSAPLRASERSPRPAHRRPRPHGAVP